MTRRFCVWKLLTDAPVEGGNMKNLTMKIVVSAAVLAFATPSLAQQTDNKFYGSVGYFFGSYEEEFDDSVREGMYQDVPVGGGATADFTVTDFDDFEADAKAFLLRFGYQFHPNFSVEGRYGIGSGSDKGSASISLADVDVAGYQPVNALDVEVESDVELDDLYGIFLRAGISAGQFYPYAIIGYTEGEGEVSNQRIIATVEGDSIVAEADINEDETESDFSYGVGADFRFTDSIAMNAEWMSYLDKDGAKIGGFQLGLVFAF